MGVLVQAGQGRWIARHTSGDVGCGHGSVRSFGLAGGWGGARDFGVLDEHCEVAVGRGTNLGFG